MYLNSRSDAQGGNVYKTGVGSHLGLLHGLVGIRSSHFENLWALGIKEPVMVSGGALI